MQTTKPNTRAQFLPLDSRHYGATRDAAAFLTTPEMFALIGRHRTGDWGEVCASDAAANDASLMDGSRVLSSYTVRGEQVWIITDAADDNGERLATTILTPEEY